jgi:tRNA threonylcarbamoyladenosine biosynthesis protein TsaB
MRILAFDSSGNGCSAALLAEDGIVAHEADAIAHGQAERLVPMIARVLKAANLDAADLDLIAVTVGPGAFTGVRIGIATAQGLALATGRPALGLTSFETVAAAVPDALLRERALAVALDSRRAELYLQAFGAGRVPLGLGALVAPEAWLGWAPETPLVLAGDGAERLSSALAGRDHVRAPGPGNPDARVLAELAARRWRAGETPPRLEPLYLHGADVIVARRAAP